MNYKRIIAMGMAVLVMAAAASCSKEEPSEPVADTSVVTDTAEKTEAAA